MNNYDTEAPVKEGDIVEIEITGKGNKGDCFGKIEGYVLFVPNSEQGEIITVKVTKVLSNFGFAEIQ